MSTLIKSFMVTGFALLAALRMQAQDTAHISGNYTNVAFGEFVKDIEPQCGCRFYFDKAETDSILLNVSFKNVSLSTALQLAFKHTPLKFTLDGYRVFVTSQFEIKPLPGNFFEDNTVGTDVAGSNSKTNVGAAQGQIITSTLENKLFEIGAKQAKPPARATIAGYVRDIKSGEPIAGASVYIVNPAITVITDQFGYYNLSVAPGRYEISISSIGMKDTKRQVVVYSNGKLDMDMQAFIPTLKEVIVTSDKGSNVRGLQMGVDRLSSRLIKQIPVVFGETDITRVVLTLPGVTTVGEAANGFNVRGGSTDQNLILFDDVTIYNSSHLFGFFSAFDPELVKGIELYKSAIPVKYGGRLSSVLDVAVKDGNVKTWTGQGGIGPLTGKFYIEGPLKKNKTSIIAGGRTTYSSWLLRSLPDDYKNSAAGFSDLSMHISHTVNNKNTLYFTGYLSADNFNLNNDTTYKYNSRNAGFKWKHNFNNNFSNVFTAAYNHYDYAVSSTQNPVNAFKLGFNINQADFRSDFTYTPNNKQTVSFGISSVFYKLHPGFYEPVGSKSLVVQNVVPGEQGIESALYIGDEYAVSQKLSITAGLRYSMFNYLGAHSVYGYVPGIPRSINTITDTTNYGSGKFIKTYQAPEVRVALRYSLPDNSSLKFSFNTMQQYIQMLSNTTAISPTDIWKLSDPYIKPQQGQQVSLGFYKNFNANTIEVSVEVYYKLIQHFLDYKSGANLVLNSHIETDVINTRGKAYGVEFLIKKLSGKLNGWLSYTYSRTLLKADDPLAGESINKGAYYPASFDKPHNVNLIGNYQFSHRISISANFVYSTGRPVTLPLAVFTLGGSPSLYYSERNQYRIPDYIRGDISATLEGNHRIKQKTHNSWSVGVYNVFARQNAYSVYFIQQNGLIKGYQLSIFGTAIPFITYNIKF